MPLFLGVGGFSFVGEVDDVAVAELNDDDDDEDEDEDEEDDDDADDDDDDKDDHGMGGELGLDKAIVDDDAQVNDGE